jgi:hypothetical protein
VPEYWLVAGVEPAVLEVLAVEELLAGLVEHPAETARLEVVRLGQFVNFAPVPRSLTYSYLF